MCPNPTTKVCIKCGQEKPLDAFRQTANGNYRNGCRTCANDKKRSDYAANPEKHRAYAREHARLHPEKVRAAQSKYSLTHREKRLATYKNHNATRREQQREYDRQRRAAMNSDERKAQLKKWHDRMRETGSYQRYRIRIADRFRQYNQRWTRENPQKNRDKSNRYRARKAGAPQVEVIDRAAIIARDNSTCYLWCGRVLKDHEVTLDHVIPLVRGGSHTADNLRVACRSCNSRKSARLLSELSDYP